MLREQESWISPKISLSHFFLNISGEKNFFNFFLNLARLLPKERRKLRKINKLKIFFREIARNHLNPPIITDFTRSRKNSS